MITVCGYCTEASVTRKTKGSMADESMASLDVTRDCDARVLQVNLIQVTLSLRSSLAASLEQQNVASK